MKQSAAFSLILASAVLGLLLLSPIAAPLSAYAAGTCENNIDDDGDKRVDWNGSKDGLYPPDPSCINAKSDEVADDIAAGSLIPCTNKCDINSFFQLLNTAIKILVKFILFPVTIILCIYAGYTYIVSGDNPGKRANVKKMLKHLILGVLLILGAWLIVRTALKTLGYDNTLYFFNE